MKSFLSNELEPVAYLIYMAAVLLYYNQYKSTTHKILAFYYAGAAAVFYAGIVTTAYLNNWTYNLVYLANICIFSWYFRQLLHSRLKKGVITVCLVANILLFIYYDIIQQTFYSNFNSFVYGAVFMSIVLYTLMYLHQILDDIKEEHLLLNFDFWLICGYLMYFLGSFIVVIYYEGADINERADMWIMPNIILFICSVITLSSSLKITKKR